MNFGSKIQANNGINVKPVAGDLASPVDGDIWYNSTIGKFRKKENGTIYDLDSYVFVDGGFPTSVYNGINIIDGGTL